VRRQQAGFSLAHDVTRPVAIRADDRRSGGQRLDQHLAEALVARAVGIDARHLIIRREIAVRHAAGEDHPFHARFLHELRPPREIAYHHQPCGRMRAPHAAERFKQQLDVFDRRGQPDPQDHGRVRREAERVTQRGDPFRWLRHGEQGDVGRRGQHDYAFGGDAHRKILLFLALGQHAVRVRALDDEFADGVQRAVA
jgi:hypothetical protein